MKIEIADDIHFNLAENMSTNKNLIPYILTVWAHEGSEIVFWLTEEEYKQLKEELK